MLRHRLSLAAALLLVVAGSCWTASQATSGTTEAKESGPEVLPRLVHSVVPEYPKAESEQGIEGLVHLRILVTVEGKVDSIRAEKEVEGHPAFTTACEKAVREFRFEPATCDGGKPCPCWLTVPFKFALEEKKAKS